MQQYLNMFQMILDNGESRDDRTGVGTIGVFGHQEKFDLRQGFPLLTTKRVFWRGVVHELLWFLSGSSNIKYLVDNNVSIWSDWPAKYYNQQNPDHPYSVEDFEYEIRIDSEFAKQWGELGPVYGVQWRKWFSHHEYNMHSSREWEKFPREDKEDPDGEYEGSFRPVYIDQISNLIHDLKTNPNSRRHIVSAWNVADIPEMIPSGLPPCHLLFQFSCAQLSIDQRHELAGEAHHYDANHEYYDVYKVPRYHLDLQLYMRSADIFLGIPLNIASYSLLLHMVAAQVNMIPRNFISSFGDLHIYKNHLDQVKEQLTRTPTALPTIKLNPNVKSIFDYKPEDIELIDYHPQATIKAPIAV